MSGGFASAAAALHRAGDSDDLCTPFLAALPITGVAISTLGDPIGSETVCASDSVAAQIDEIQLDLGEGPCWEAMLTGKPVLQPDLQTATTDRWPFALSAIREIPMGAAFAFPMRLGDLDIGAVDLYSDAPIVLEADTVRQAMVLAEGAARQVLRRVLARADSGTEEGGVEGESEYSRREVYQASGMIAAQTGVAAADALLAAAESRIRCRTPGQRPRRGRHRPNGRLHRPQQHRPRRLCLVGKEVAMTRTREQHLVETFVALTDSLVGDYDVVDLLQLLVDNAVELFDVSAAGIMLANQRQQLEVIVSTSERSNFIGLMQLEAGEGPCVEAFATSETVSVEDADEMRRRWPLFADVSEQVGYASVHSVPLRLRDSTLGSLNLFRETPGALNDADATAVRALTDVATISILQQRTTDHATRTQMQLQRALDTRIIIEQAKGYLAHTHQIDMEAAFRLLRDFARSNQMRIADAAHAVVDHGALNTITK